MNLRKKTENSGEKGLTIYGDSLTLFGEMVKGFPPTDPSQGLRRQGSSLDFTISGFRLGIALPNDRAAASQGCEAVVSVCPEELTRQVWVGRNSNGDAPCPELMKPITNQKYRMKPSGGLWTSTYLEDGLCGWHQWCLSDGAVDWVDDKPIYLLTIASRTTYYTINSKADLLHLAKTYGVEGTMPDYPGWTMRGLDFETMVSDGIEGLHLTDKGQWRTRWGDSWNLYGWDCESTIWLKWVFEDVKHLGKWNKQL